MSSRPAMPVATKWFLLVSPGASLIVPPAFNRRPARRSGAKAERFRSVEPFHFSDSPARSGGPAVLLNASQYPSRPYVSTDNGCARMTTPPLRLKTLETVDALAERELKRDGLRQPPLPFPLGSSSDVIVNR